MVHSIPGTQGFSAGVEEGCVKLASAAMEYGQCNSRCAVQQGLCSKEGALT